MVKNAATRARVKCLMAFDFIGCGWLVVWLMDISAAPVDSKFRLKIYVFAAFGMFSLGV